MQSDVFMYVLKTVKDSIKRNIKTDFAVVDAFSENKNQIRVYIKDLFQVSNDKTGQRIIYNEIRYEVPAQYEMRLCIEFNGQKTEEVLSALGQVAVYFKDNN